MIAQQTSRVALVTGGSSGIGFAIVKRLLSDGHKVAFCGHDVARIDQAMARIQDADDPQNVLGLKADVKCNTDVEALFSQIRKRLGPVEILVNNAGVSLRRKTAEPWIGSISIEEWQRVLTTNLTGAFLCARLAAQDMMKRRWGRIVNISSIAGRTVPHIAGPHYAASKAGLIGLTRSLASDLAPFGVTVNCVAPGRILTSMTGPAESENNKRALQRIPVARLGDPDDIAAAVSYLVSEDSGFVNAATLDVNGGEFG